MRAPEDMLAACRMVETAVRGGAHAVILIPYESAPVFDPALRTHAATGPLPLAWIGLYRDRQQIRTGEAGPNAGSFTLGAWRPALDPASHADAVDAIRRYIGSGDAYQVNFTFAIDADFSGDPAGLYREMCLRQGSAAFCAYVDFGDTAVLSASPELFFAVDGEGRIRTRPMKGTRRRGLWTAQDDGLRQSLVTSSKDRAENLMIVDLLRNDLGRIAEPGSVEVSTLWNVEPYDTVWQMTSAVAARTRCDAGLYDLLAALFPCGSVTGAPKVRASEIIGELESGPRGTYTGTIGYVSPSAGPEGRTLSGLEAVFNVAIRTVVVDRQAGRATAGIGGGITWDSETTAEYQECLDKTLFLPRPTADPSIVTRNPSSDFDLVETLLFEADTGYYLVERHLRRLMGSARYFGFTCNEACLRERLSAAAADPSPRRRVRLSLSRNGLVAVEAVAIGSQPPSMRVILAAGRVDPQDVFLYHKTTRREAYVAALAQARAAGVDEAILRNDREELTECTIGNLVVEQGGRRLTPPLCCGLLPGTLREELLETGQIEEQVLTVADLNAADAVYLINSVRRWIRLDMLPATEQASKSTKEKRRVQNR
ncbi:MAG: aminodeoxychorismate synthase component I [bacterium]|nr:aminodeoxychorismate synthase component I [bacterium]